MGLIKSKGMIVQFDDDNYVLVMKILSPLKFEFMNIDIPNNDWIVLNSFVPTIYHHNNTKLLMLGGKNESQTQLPLFAMFDKKTLDEFKIVWNYISDINNGEHCIIKGDFIIDNHLYKKFEYL